MLLIATSLLLTTISTIIYGTAVFRNVRYTVRVLVGKLGMKLAIKLIGYDFTKKPTVDYTGRAILLGDIYLEPQEGLVQNQIDFEGIHGFMITNDRDKGIYIRVYEEKKRRVRKELK